MDHNASLAVCIPVDWLTETLGAQRLEQIGYHFADLEATVGHDLTNREYRLASLLQDRMAGRASYFLMTPFGPSFGPYRLLTREGIPIPNYFVSKRDLVSPMLRRSVESQVGERGSSSSWFSQWIRA